MDKNIFRTDVQEANDELNNNQFSWIPFYEEMAHKLLEYKDNREKLVKIVFGLDKQFVNYIKDNDGNDYSDLDPFSVFAIFNRGLTDKNRIEICQYFKEQLSLNADLPKDFKSIPIVNNMLSVFVWRDNIQTETQRIWDLFEAAMQDNLNKELFVEAFNKVQNQKGIKWNLTMGLFWTNPYKYMPLDEKSRDYFKKQGISVFDESELTGENYLQLLDEIKLKIDNGEIEEKNFPEISYNAWRNTLASNKSEESAIQNLIEKYKVYIKKNGGLKGIDELYKWELTTKYQGKPDLKAVDFKSEIQQLNFENLIYHNANTTIKQLSEANPEKYREAFKKLFDETISLQERMDAFLADVKELYKSLGYSLQSHHDERTAASFLTFHAPNKYTFYKDGVYKYLCNILHVMPQNAGKKYVHYLQLLNEKLIPVIAADKDLQQLTDNETKDYVHSDLLLAQTILWVNLNNNQSRYWLVGYAFGGTDSQLDSFFENSTWIGGFDSVKDKKQIDLAEEIKAGDVIALKSTSTKGTLHDQPFLRIKAIGIVKSINTSTSSPEKVEFTCDVDYINKDEKDFEGNEYGAFRKTIHELKNKEIMDYLNRILNNNIQEEEPRYDKYISLLKANHNLIFTGAPGTGKTYLAKEIAKAMNAETAFVQFHPSYDYTDFVEGLRPTQSDNNGNIGFERKDGVFKEFCKQAVSVNIIEEEAIDSFDLSNFQMFLETSNIKRTSINSYIIKIEQLLGIKGINSTKEIQEYRQYSSLDDICDNHEEIKYFDKINDFHNWFASACSNLINFRDSLLTSQKFKKSTEEKPFVFIIDEINRGEISKIFGELFFSIDPGYRGETGLVQTQYQNLIEEGDAFKKGFYVPENVYIIGTMNDIDRSVESMDFAMRRRFAWQEITAAESAENMGLSNEIKSRMKRLNDAISKIEGLNSSYHIGGSYFLKEQDADKLWDNHLRGLLFEYLRGMPDADGKLNELRTAYDGTITND